MPLCGRLAEALTGWLGPAFGDEAGRGSNLRLWYDVDQVDALSDERAALWDRVASVDFLTLNEKRAAVGYGPVEGGDGLGPPPGKSIHPDFALEQRYNPNWQSQPRVAAGNPEGGRWTEVAGTVIRICVASGIGRFADGSYVVIYECADGREIRLEGFGNPRGLIRDRSR